MNKREFARLEMYERLAACFNENAAAIDAIPAFRDSADRFTAQLATLKSVYDDEKAGSQGATRTKREQRETLCNRLASLCAAVFAQADESGNTALRTAMDVQAYELRELRSSELVQQSRHLMATIAPHIAALAPYAILPADLAAIQTEIDSFEALKEEPRTIISDRKTAGTNNEALFEAVDREIEARLDKIISRFDSTAPAFVSAYRSRRIIVDPLTLPTRLVIDVSALRGGPVAGASVTLNGTDIAGTTDSQGACPLVGIRPGAWTVSIHHPAYRDGTLNDVIVRLGRTTRMKAELEAN